MINIYVKVEVFIFTHYGKMKDNATSIWEGDLGANSSET